MRWFKLFFHAMFLVAALSRAGDDALINETFDKLDLNALPAGWVATTPDVSLEEVEGRGKALRINHNGQSKASLTINLDRQVVAGGTVGVNVRVKVNKPYTPDIEKKAIVYVGLRISTNQGGRMQLTPMPAQIPDWQKVTAQLAIPADAQGASVVLAVSSIAADAYFDDLVITLTGKPLLKEGAPANADAGPASRTKGPDPAASATPAQREKISKLPRKSLDADGMVFDAAVLIRGLNAVKSGMKKNAYAQVGPGAPFAGVTAKSIANWALLNTDSKNVQGVPTEKLAVTLPTYLATHKPEVAFLIFGAKTERLVNEERSEWEDLALICYRYGTIPVMVVPSANEEQRKTMLEAAQSVNCAVLDQKEPLDRRMQQVLSLIEQHIFDRKPPVESVDE